ncbi:porin family protein [candidate division KSB1 bacterium]|nr:porin family protein [candidate division KSB1 bacterium]NIR69548.1 porin family protein [candidate division KSB1 bacterium]NIS22858.1 porin family protein [candidate division KSB1 bacterium]NIT69695.1 porin family protein [candidate division KSB1 bacterium]NIU23364.1 porin family protein [candidate division KSB1 bacterium]
MEKTSFKYVTALIFVLALASLLSAQEQTSARFSHKGIKGLVAFGRFENDFGRELNDGEGGSLSLGYGFSDKFTLWLTALGVEHPQNAVNHSVTDFAGLELNLQYKFLADTPIQPYGKVGVGFYAFEEQGTEVTVTGGGLALGLGADYFFSKHFGIGAELMIKNIEFDKQRRHVPGNKVVSDSNAELEGESIGFMITLTIQ